MNDTDIIEETPIQIILNRQAGFRTEIEDILEKRSMEVYRAVNDLTREIHSLKEERDQMKEALQTILEASNILGYRTIGDVAEKALEGMI